MKGKARLTIEMWSQKFVRVASLAFDSKNLSPHSPLSLSLYFFSSLETCVRGVLNCQLLFLNLFSKFLTGLILIATDNYFNGTM